MAAAIFMAEKKRFVSSIRFSNQFSISNFFHSLCRDEADDDDVVDDNNNEEEEDQQKSRVQRHGRELVPQEEDFDPSL
jgi:hypothetical protein